MLPLSVVIITYNEASNIADCIQSVQSIADEILVLDSFSSDKTLEIAESMGAKVISHTFDGHIQQKNRAKNLAKNDWVLSLDADERLSDKLKISIQNALQDPVKNGYTMNRLNFFCGKPIKTCGWYPDNKLRLWKKNEGNWGGTNPHDRFELNGNQSTENLKGDILHYTYPTKVSMKNQVQKFANIAAVQNKNKPIAYLIYKMVFSTLFKFIRSYFLKAGLTDGADGWYICTQQAKEVYLKYRRALALKSTNS